GGRCRPDWGIGAPGRAARAWQARWQAAATGCRTAPPGAAAAHDPCGARKRRCAELCCGRIWTWRAQPPPCWTPYAPASTGLGHRGSDVLHQIGFLPGETAVLVWCSAEMAVSGGAAIDRPVELERAADVDRREPEDFGERFFELLLFALAGASHSAQRGQRVGAADGIGVLNGAAFGNAGGDDVLGEMARGIGRRAVALGRILAGESAAAVGGVAAIGVDDDLAAG